MWWSNLFVDMNKANFFNFSFLPKYATSFVRGLEYTLLLAVVSVLLAIIPALLLALMRLSKNRIVRSISGAYIALFRSTPLLVQLSLIYFGLFGAISIPRVTILGFVDISRFIPGLRRGDLPRRHPRRRQGADRGGPLAGPLRRRVDALRRAAAGDQKRPARARQ